MNAKTRRHATFAAFILASALALTGCATTTTTTVRTPSSAPAATVAAAGSPSSAAGSPSAAAGSPSASSVPCTTHSCIVTDAEQSMVGTSAKDGSVVTKATCFKSSVKSNPGDTYTVSCNITYTDGTVWNGLVTLLLASDQVSWQPESEVS